MASGGASGVPAGADQTVDAAVLRRRGRETARLSVTPNGAAFKQVLDGTAAAPEAPHPTAGWADIIPKSEGATRTMDGETAEPAERAETAAVPYAPEVLEAMACDIGARPERAPHLSDLAGEVRAVRRKAGALVVEYEPAAVAALEAAVEAERWCCPEIGWHLEQLAPNETGGVGRPGGVARLRIAASPAQLDVLGSLFGPVVGSTAVGRAQERRVVVPDLPAGPGRADRDAARRDRPAGGRPADPAGVAARAPASCAVGCPRRGLAARGVRARRGPGQRPRRRSQIPASSAFQRAPSGEGSSPYFGRSRATSMEVRRWRR